MTRLSTSSPASLTERLFALLLTVLPHHLLSRAMYAVTRCTWPPLKDRLIRWAVGHYRIDLDEVVDDDLDDYASFNAFFTRALLPEARPVDRAQGSIVSPVDAEVSQAGPIESNLMLQAKGHHFTLKALLGDSALADRFVGGRYATLYLSPRDYHRIHMPVDGHLQRMIHVPGRLFSVNQGTTRAVPDLFARNERIVNIFDTPAGPMALIMVGAIFVGSMDTVWAGSVAPADRRATHWRYDGIAETPVDLSKGEEMGRFNMGSTVILLFAKDRVAWDEKLAAGNRVRVGQRIGGMVSAA